MGHNKINNKIAIAERAIEKIMWLVQPCIEGCKECSHRHCRTTECAWWYGSLEEYEDGGFRAVYNETFDRIAYAVEVTENKVVIQVHPYGKGKPWKNYNIVFEEDEREDDAFMYTWMYRCPTFNG